MSAAGSFTDKKERFSPIRHLDFTMQAYELKSLSFLSSYFNSVPHTK